MQRLLAFFFAAALLWTPAWSQSAPDALVPDLSQYILTPPAPPTPRINGAKVFGARPGSEFLFAIPASGDRPMTFAAEGLPKGLSLDPSTGFITGRVKKPGTYLVKLTARNALGEATRELRIVIGERIALTPPMGWNSWNCWARDVTQEQVLSSARAMVESGLVNHGWTYINIDDGWQGRRGGRYNAIQTNDNQTKSGVIDLFVESLKNPAVQGIDAQSVLTAMRAVFAAIESSETGRRVKTSEI